MQALVWAVIALLPVSPVATEGAQALYEKARFRSTSSFTLDWGVLLEQFFLQFSRKLTRLPSYSFTIILNKRCITIYGRIGSFKCARTDRRSLALFMLLVRKPKAMKSEKAEKFERYGLQNVKIEPCACSKFQIRDVIDHAGVVWMISFAADS